MSRSDGRFVPEKGPGSTLALMLGTEVDAGPCMVVRHGGVTVLLTNRRTSPFDLGQWRSQGIDPEDLFTIGVKAAVEHRPAYDPMAEASYTVDTPEPCTENLRGTAFVSSLQNVTSGRYAFPKVVRFVVAAFAHGPGIVSYRRTTSNAVELPEVAR